MLLKSHKKEGDSNRKIDIIYLSPYPNIEKEYDLETYCDIVMQELRTKYNSMGKRKVTREELLQTLYNDFKYLPDALNYIRELSENSGSVYETSQVLKIMMEKLLQRI